MSHSLPPRLASSFLAVFNALAISGAAFAASETWSNSTGDAGTNWSQAANWVSGTIPGTTSLVTSNTDVATFPASVSIEQPILDTGRRLGRVIIDNSLGSYNIGTGITPSILFLQQTGAATPQLSISGGGATTISAHVRIGTANSVGNAATWNTGSTAVILSNGLSYASVGDTYFNLSNTVPLTISGSVFASSSSGGTLRFLGNGSAIISGSIQNGPAGTTTINSQETFTGTVRLSGSNSFTSDIIWRAGTLEIANNNALGNLASAGIQLGSSVTPNQPSSLLTTGTYTVSRQLRISASANNASITVGGSHTSGTSVYSGDFNLLNHNGGVRLTAAAGGVVEFSGVLSGANTAQAMITKVGDGVVKLGNANTYAGATTISAGTLLVSNSTGSGAGTGSVAVNNSGTFGGTGAVSGTVTINAGGVLSPGDLTAPTGSRAGTMGTGSLVFNGGALTMNISGSTPGDGAGFYDQVQVTGIVTLSSDVAFTMTLDGYNPPDDGTVLFTLIDNDSGEAITGSGLFSLNGTTLLTQGAIFTVEGQSFQISYTSGGTVGTFIGGGNDIAILAVPEPSTALLLVSGLGLSFVTRRCRKQ